MTTYQQSIVAMSRGAVDSLLNSARATPEERLTWKPMDSGRSVLNQLAEVVQVAGWFTRIFETKKADFFDRDFIVSERQKRDELTMADIEAQIGPAHESLYAAILALSDADLDIKIALRPGWESTLRDVCYYPLRNLWYHFGQVNYVQTLYGDMEMH